MLELERITPASRLTSLNAGASEDHEEGRKCVSEGGWERKRRWTATRVKDEEGISHRRGVLYWKSFHIAHVNMQLEPHVQSMALQGHHTCAHKGRCSGGCMLSFLHGSL